MLGYGNDMEGVARLLIGLGVILVLAGVAVLLLGRVPWLGRLPGDMTIRRDGLTIYVPLATCLLVSALLSLLLYVVRK